MTNHLAIPKRAQPYTSIPQIGRGFTVNSTGALLRPIDPMAWARQMSGPLGRDPQLEHKLNLRAGRALHDA